MQKQPCVNGCIMCGTCCVCYVIRDEPALFYKPAFVKCDNLVYKDGHAICGVHGTDKQPKTCKEYQAEKNAKRMWFEQRLRVYKHRDYSEHMVWAFQQGYLDHLPIIKSIKAGEYSTDVMDRFYELFVLPHIRHVAGALASEPDWFRKWNLKDYFANMPAEAERRLVELAQETCLAIYRKKTVPEHVQKVLNGYAAYPCGKWIVKLCHALWGK